MKPSERFVRVCAIHRRPLEPSGTDELYCPGTATVSRHRATSWFTYDREKRQALDVVDEKKGHQRELREPLKVEERAPAAPAPHTEDDMPKGYPGSGPGGGAPKPVKQGARVLETRRYVVGEAAVLIVRVRQVGGKDDASRFRIEWQHSERQGKTVNLTKGTVHFAATETEIREAWAAQLAGLSKRWTPAPLTRLKLAPIPEPPKGH